MALQPPHQYLCWDHRESNHGPVFGVESVALCCLIPVSLPSFVLFIFTNRFLFSRAQCWYFLCDVKIATMAICCLLWGVIRKHCSTTTVVCLFSESNHLFSLFVCFSVTVLWKKVYLLFNCKLFFNLLHLGATEPWLNVSVAATASSSDSIKWSLS